MRDPKRIRPLLDRLARAWSTFPDLRLGQLIENAMATRAGHPYPPLFYIEDEDLVRTVETYVTNAAKDRGGQ